MQICQLKANDLGKKYCINLIIKQLNFVKIFYININRMLGSCNLNLMFITFKKTATRTAIHHSTEVSVHNEMNCCPSYNMIDDLCKKCWKMKETLAKSHLINHLALIFIQITISANDSIYSRHAIHDEHTPKIAALLLSFGRQCSGHRAIRVKGRTSLPESLRHSWLHR